MPSVPVFVRLKQPLPGKHNLQPYELYSLEDGETTEYGWRTLNKQARAQLKAIQAPQIIDKS